MDTILWIVGILFIVGVICCIVDRYICIHKWDELENREQKCKNCGIVRIIDCSHKWEKINTSNRNQNDLITGFMHLLQCKKCGEMKNHTESVHF